LQALDLHLPDHPSLEDQATVPIHHQVHEIPAALVLFDNPLDLVDQAVMDSIGDAIWMWAFSPRIMGRGADG
jgi:hypothetical protein